MRSQQGPGRRARGRLLGCHTERWGSAHIGPPSCRGAGTASRTSGSPKMPAHFGSPTHRRWRSHARSLTLTRRHAGGRHLSQTSRR
ncbi:hypothetical protein C3Y91_15155 [Rhizobium sp. UPM1133]|nr:hypothetical protein [Rhizobium ruizarguesonis]